MNKNPSAPTQKNSDIVDSLLHPSAVELRQLLNGSQEERPRRMIIDDEENIVQALRARIKIERVFHTEDQDLSEGLKAALLPDATVHIIAKRTCKKLFETHKSSRVFAVAQTPPLPTLIEFAAFKKDIVVLENLGISGNIGAIVRTAVAFDVGGIVLLDSGMDMYDRRLIRASRGHVFSLPIVKAATAELLTFCKQHHWPLLVTNPHAARPVETVAGLRQRLAIAFGNEKEGCSQALHQAARFQIRIPTHSLVESLNVSAAAIILFHRQSEASRGVLAPRRSR